MALFDEVKVALRRTCDDDGLDAEIQRDIEAAFQDLNMAGVLDRESIGDEPVVKNAVITYCLMRQNVGETGYDAYKRAYDEQKAQLQMSTGFTDWGDSE